VSAVVLAVLGAGLIHAIWNAAAKSLPSQFASFALLNLGAAGLCWLTWPFIGLPARASWGYLGAAVVCHLGYEWFLLSSNRRNEFSRAYPIARGAAPALVSIAGLVFASEHLGLRGGLGVAAVVLGIASLAWRRRDGSPGPSGLWWALATGAAIATYTVVDGLGVRASHDALRYGATLFTLQSTTWVVGAVLRRGWRWWPARRVALVGLGAGVLSILGYVVVLWAQTRAPLGVVSALRETGVLWAAVIGAVVFKENSLRRVVAPALAVVLGVALLSLS
jgi:drug/metabolite transporter (DMT)-like permease